MTIIENTVHIARPAKEVFEFVSDLRNERRWNPGLEAVEKLSEGAIGAGTRYRAKWKGFPEFVVECTGYDPPRTYDATNVGSAPLGVKSRFTVTPSGHGATLATSFTATPHGMMRLAFPVVLRSLRRQHDRNIREIKRVLEST